MFKAIGRLGKGLATMADAFDAEVRRESAQDRRLSLISASLETMVEKLSELNRNLSAPKLVVGVQMKMTHVSAEPLSEQVDGRCAVMRVGDPPKRFKFSPQRPANVLELEAWGGCVITDVLVGNYSLMLDPSGGIRTGAFRCAISVGNCILVVVALPTDGDCE